MDRLDGKTLAQGFFNIPFLAHGVKRVVLEAIQAEITRLESVDCCLAHGKCRCAEVASEARAWALWVETGWHPTMHSGTNPADLVLVDMRHVKN